jgi:hypothetical protein
MRKGMWLIFLSLMLIAAVALAGDAKILRERSPDYHIQCYLILTVISLHVGYLTKKEMNEFYTKAHANRKWEQTRLINN